jgi:hypothetical protein
MIARMDHALRRKLLDLIAEDERVRAELAADGSLFAGYHPRMAAVHASNAQALESELEAGWPGKERVGDDGAEAAWRIVQHSIALPVFQRKCLALIDDAISRGDGPAWQSAFLLDRIRMFEGRPQVFGTQFDWDENGAMSPLPIEDAENVDARRKAVGMQPLAQAVAQHRAAAKDSGARPPADRAARLREVEVWARSVGWRA